MEGRVNYMAVGIFVVVLTAVLIVAIFWLSEVGRDSKYRTYLVYVHENVTGLSIDSPVRFNGVKIGYVEGMHLDAKNPKLVKIVLKIEQGVRITTSTTATLNTQGITGVIYVNLKAEMQEAPLLKPKPGERYPVIKAKPSLLMQLSRVLPELTKDIQSLTTDIAKLLDKENRDSLRNSLRNVENFTQALSDSSGNVRSSMKSLRSSLANISEASKDMPSVLSKLKDTLSSVDKLSQHMTKTSTTIQSTMESGSVAIQHFSNQVLPSAQHALNGLGAATTSIHQLTNELQRNPSMLIRGKQQAQLGPGERP